MAFQRPTLQSIIDRVEADIKSALNIVTILRRSFLAAMARAVAGAAHILHGHLLFISKQIFPDQAELEFLERWASIYGLQRKEATFGQITVKFTGTDTTVIPAGTLIQLPDGMQYETDASATIGSTTSGEVDVACTAVESGSASNVLVDDTLTLVSGISGVDGEVNVESIEIEGEDEETDALFRERLVARIQQPPDGGSASFYIQTALEVAGVTRAWVFPGHLGEGTVGVSFVEDNDSVSIIPDSAKIDEVQAIFDNTAPVTADVVVFAPVPKDLDIEIALKPNTVDVQNAVLAELEDLILRDAQVGGSYKQVGENYDGKILLSRITEAISIAAGEEDHEVTSPTTDFLVNTGELAVLGTVTFTTLS